MKKLLVMLLFCVSAHAEEYLVTNTEGGGEIVLSLSRGVTTCGDHLYWMYMVTKSGDVFYGCWAYMHEKIHVRFDNGIRKVYDLDGWTKRSTK
jgi:hypothetical protein